MLWHAVAFCGVLEGAQALFGKVQVTAGNWALEDFLKSRSSIDEEELTLTMDASVSCRYILSPVQCITMSSSAHIMD